MSENLVPLAMGVIVLAASLILLKLGLSVATGGSTSLTTNMVAEEAGVGDSAGQAYFRK